MAAPAAIRTGIKTRIDTITGLQGYDRIPDSINPPCALVLPDEPFITRKSMGVAAGTGTVELNWRILIIASKAVSVAGQTKLDGYLATSGATSVWVALEGDKTLGGAVSNCAVQQVSSYGDVEWNGNGYWGAEIKFATLATG